MKLNNILLITALFFANTAFSQEAFGFGSFFGIETTSWNGVTEYYDCPIENHIFRSESDTLMDGCIYKRIEYYLAFQNDDYYHEYRDSDYDFYLREDTANGRLWCRFPDENEDFLIVDMSLAMNDTILLRDYYHYDYGPLQYSHWTIIDTSRSDNGKKIVLKCLTDNRTVEFIEGVGCTNLFDYLRYPMIGSGLLCCHKDGVLVYRNSGLDSDGDCIVPFVGISECYENTDVSIFPNPCHDWLKIDGDQVLSATLYDTMGKIVIDKLDFNKSVNICGIPKGTYFLRIDLEGFFMTKTIIIQ